MKNLWYVLVLFYGLEANAQTYLISFAGTGESSSLSTVKVENLMSRASLNINGSDILRLNVLTGVNSIDDKQLSGLKIYPNPMTDNSTLEILPPVAGNAVITVYEMTGKPIAQIQSNLENEIQDYNISGVKNGLYIISVKGNNYQLSGILLSNSKSNVTIKIEKVNNIIQSVDEKTSKKDRKGTQATVEMAYTAGDRLKLTGLSGIYSTTITDIPAGSKTITFNFIACTDGDNYNYPVVEIGTQVWMAENLKTSTYNNGDIIGTTTPATADISGESTPKYQWPSNGNEDYVATNGRLYTWYTVTNTRNACPTGWHVPADTEWTTLIDYLTNNGYGYGGSGNLIAKSMAATSGWTPSDQPGNIGNDQASNNRSGFTAFPGGYRDANGSFYGFKDYGYEDKGTSGFLWSSTEYSASDARGRFMGCIESVVHRFSASKRSGFSVRCLKD